MGGDGGAGREAQRAREEEQARQARITAGTVKLREMFGTQFTPDYYKTKIEDPARKLYQPQVETDYANSLKQLQFALARNGFGLGKDTSTLYRQKMADAQRQKLLADDRVTNEIQNLVAGRKGDVANAETAALNQLQASGDPISAAAQAANQIDARSQTPQFQPLGQVFTDFTAGLATQADLERSGQNRYNFGVSNWGNNTSRWIKNIGGR
jgi:hypothetical protein